MSDLLTQFCFELSVTQEQFDWLNSKNDEIVDNMEVLDESNIMLDVTHIGFSGKSTISDEADVFGLNISKIGPDNNGRFCAAISSDGYGCALYAGHLVNLLMLRFKDDSDLDDEVTFGFSNTTTKLSIDGFSGGRVRVTKDGITLLS